MESNSASNQKIVYLHIGVPKTASSTIQRGLFENLNALKNDGYLYPKNGLLDTNHKNIFFELTSLVNHNIKFSPAAGNIDSLVTEINTSALDKVIISAEHLALLITPEIQFLKEHLEPFSTRVIVYLRRQDQVIQSGWSQNAKRLVTNKDLDGIIEEEFSTDASVYHYDYLLDNWAHVFGKENIILRIFEPEHLSGHIFHDFLQTCGISTLDNYKIPKSSNVSPSYKTMGVILEITKRLNFDQIDPITRVEIGRQIEFICNQLGWNQDKKYNAIDKKTFERIMDHFQPGNNKVAQEYLGRDKLFSESFSRKRLTKFKLKKVDQSQLLDIFAHVLNSFNITLKKEDSSIPAQE